MGGIDDCDARPRSPHASQRIVEGQQHVPADPVAAAILGGYFR